MHEKNAETKQKSVSKRDVEKKMTYVKKKTGSYIYSS